jgi:hypothetical protein
MSDFVLGIFGQRGSGKTYLQMNTILPELERRGETIFVLDSMNECPAGIAFTRARALYGYVQAGKPNASGVYCLQATSRQDGQACFDMLVRLGEAAKKRRRRVHATIIIDEASKYSAASAMAGEMEGLNRLIHYGRHWGYSIIYNSRRPTEVSTDLRSASDAIISFRQTHKRDVKRMEEFDDQFGPHVDDLSKEDHEYLVLGYSQAIPFEPTLMAGAVNERYE